MTTGEELINELKEYEYDYFDPKTGLEWLVVRDEDTDFESGERRIECLGDNWRLPILKELKSLYKKGLGARSMPPELKTTGWYVWSMETEGLEAWVFHFGSGGSIPSHWRSSGGRRAFAVRYRK